MSYWGGLFPASYWGWLFPEDIAAGHVDGIGPAGQFVFALSLVDGAKLSWHWLTDVFKAYDGGEKRAATIDQPKASISGQAYLIGNETRATRAALARYAASGQPFALGLPYEAIAITEPTEGTVVTVPTTLNVDWIGLGQRVIVQNDDHAIQAVIQAFDATTVTLDVALGSLGDGQCILMPSVAIYLDAQQGFARYTTPDGFETWSIAGTFAVFGFPADSRQAQTGLLGTTCPSLATCSILWGVTGSSGNTVTIQFVGDGGGADSVTRTGNAYVYHFTPGTTSVFVAINTTLEAAGFQVQGTFSAFSALTSGDAFGPLMLSGGVDGSAGSWGRSATVATHQQMPVWDRPIQVQGSDGTASDSVQAMTELLDLDGLLANVGTATQADWGRQVTLTSDQQADWQWLKLFLATARGCARTWWLPSWRSDLEVLSHTADTITIAGPSLDAGDFFAWYPQRRDLQVQQADGTIAYVTITSAVDHGDGTITLTIETDSTPIVATAPMIGTVFGSCTLEWSVGGTVGNGMTLVLGAGSPLLFPPTLVTQDSDTQWRLTYNPDYAVAADVAIAAATVGFTVSGSYTPTASVTGADAATYVLSGGADPTEAATLSDADIVTLSWIELCRFEEDDQQITFHPGQFELVSQARAVQQ